MPRVRQHLLLIVLLLNVIFINCNFGELFEGLGKYGRAVKTQESQQSTQAAYEVTVSYLESLEDQSTDPQQTPPPPDAAAQVVPSSPDASQEPIPGLAGNWDYFSATETSDHLYTITITWDGQSYLLTNCTYVYKDGSCQIHNSSWDGAAFSFTLHFPHTGYTTLHTFTQVSGDTLIGTRSNAEFGVGEIVLSRSN